MPHLLNGHSAIDIGLQDRGLQYGDGLFETIAVRRGRLEFWQQHMQRLQAGCRRLQIPCPDSRLLLAEARHLLQGRSEAVIKIIVTRGEGGRGYRAPEYTLARPNRIVSLYDWPDHPAANQRAGVAARICTTALGINPALAGIKHLNRLEQVLARSEWDDAHIHEGLMLDVHGHLIEATMSNVFFIKAGTLYTPDLANCGVAGIMRDVILDIARSGHIPCDIGHFSRADLEAADELFICNSLIGIWPLKQLEQYSFPAGPLTHQIINALDRARHEHAGHENI
ncbi:hypothetical protein Tel_09445 [Candidatus Tenderia electrophaga]|uniref:Aminodeoxychorismate lyase n=1 Tax=Candidatus Tenderia electrophaga TaxID=1748243 RepID=A0A0S2TI27_9GAMM|nr:hypothetical protein Tel_09445 [Candidatus Tenderia electrophaga]